MASFHEEWPSPGDGPSYRPASCPPYELHGKGGQYHHVMEVMVGANHDLEAGTRSFLSGFDIIAVDEVIAKRAVSLRRSRRIKLPDAVIWATAQGARHAARHAQHKGSSGRRSRRSGALQPVRNGSEDATLKMPPRQPSISTALPPGLKTSATAVSSFNRVRCHRQDQAGPGSQKLSLTQIASTAALHQ